MNQNRKVIMTALAAGMSAVLSTGPVLAASEAEDVYKEETVYVNTTAEGEVKEVTVSDWLKNSGTLAGSLEDTSDLENIKNIKGNESFTQEGKSLTWNTQGADIYYQGTTDKELPVDIRIRYYLDGSLISPEELAGKSGHLKMEVSYKNKAKNVKQIDGKTVEIYSPFVMVSGMFLPAENFTNVTIDNGKVVSDGNREMVAGIAVPGLKESLKLSEEIEEKVTIPEGFTLEADVTECEMGPVFTMAVTDVLKNLDAGEISGVDDLQNAMDDLMEASLKLVDGTKELSDGTETLEEKYQEFYDGMETLRDGVAELGSGAAELDKGAGELQDGARELNTGAGKLKEGVSAYTTGTDTLGSGVKQFTGGVSTLDGKMSEYVQGMNNLTKGVNSYVEGGDTLAGGITDYVNGATALTAGISQYTAGANTLAEGVGQYAGGIKELIGGIGQIVPGIHQEVEGIKMAASQLGAAAAAVGAVKEQVSAAGAGAAAALTDAGTQGQTMAATLGTDAAVMQNAQAQLEAWIAANGTVTIPVTTENEEGETVTENVTVSIDTSGLNAIASALSGQAGTTAGTAQNAGGQFAADLATASENMTAIGNALSGLAGDGSAAEGIEALEQGASQLENANQTLQDGYNNLAAADTEKMIAGAEKLKESGAALTEGVTALQGKDNKNAQALLDGAQKLKAVRGSITKGMKQIQTATGQLQSGVGTLASNTGALVIGAAQLSSKSDELNTGASELQDGTRTLADGAEELKAGTQKLLNGTSELSDGTSELLDGGSKLQDGIIELKDGASELQDGQEEFHEEGIQKLNDTLNEKFSEILERFEAVCSEEVLYTTFTDKKSSMDGNVKFIFETEPIEISDEE